IAASFWPPRLCAGTRRPLVHLQRSSVQSRNRNMVSSKAKNGFNCVSCGTFRGGRGELRAFAKREPRPRVYLLRGCPGRGFGNPLGVPPRLMMRFVEGSAKEIHGRGKGSSRNVWYKQPVRHALLEIPDH